jgi:hypothetical protein
MIWLESTLIYPFFIRSIDVDQSGARVECFCRSLSRPSAFHSRRLAVCYTRAMAHPTTLASEQCQEGERADVNALTLDARKRLEASSSLLKNSGFRGPF